jgi:succinate dehydrogenase / fumarate reductase flavoprotein subunit
LNNINKLETLGKVIETDILIIGGGNSGLWAAIKAKPFVNRVIVVDKGPIVGQTSAGYFSGGGLTVVQRDEDIDAFVEEITYFEDGLVEQDVVEAFARQSYQRILDLEKIGANFFKDDNGRLKGTPQRGLKHVWMYTQKPFGTGGKRILNGLSGEAKRLGVQLLSKIFITDILTSDGKAVGAVGFNFRTGEFYIFKAKSVILSTGSASILSHYPDIDSSTGGGVRMAFNAGADLRNLEFVTFWVVPKNFGWTGITNLLPMGAKFINASGEEFVDKYSPTLKSNCDYNFLAMFMALEARQGKGPIYLDCSPLAPEDREIMQPRGGWTGHQFKKLSSMGLNVLETKTEWMPGFHGMMGGAVKTNLQMETTVPGLYIAGRLRSMDPGLYMGGWALSTCAAFGCWAGENAGKYATKTKSSDIDDGQVTNLKQGIYAPLCKNGKEPEEIIQKLQKTIIPYNVTLLKNEKNLKLALKEVEDIRDNQMPLMGARDLHELKKLHEVHAMALTAELILRSSLLRTESRGSHYREDYPYRDENWLKWIVLHKENDKVISRTEPVPLNNYKNKPKRFYSDNFNLPKHGSGTSTGTGSSALSK